MLHPRGIRTWLNPWGLMCLCGVMWSGCMPQDDTHQVEASVQNYKALEQSVTLSPDAGGQDSVATVNGRHITRAEFEHEWNLHPEFSRQQVLDVLIARELFLHAYGQTKEGASDHDDSVDIHDASKRGMVQGWLKKELMATIADPDPETLEPVVSNEVTRLSSPSGYRASHLLVRVPRDAPKESWDKARVVVEKIQKELPQKATASQLFAYMLEHNEEVDGFGLAVNANMKFPAARVEAEQLEDGFIPVVEEFLVGASTIYNKQGQDVLGGPVKTPFGWHLILVHERYAPHEPAREEVKVRVRQRLKNATAQQELLNTLKDLYAMYSWSSNPQALEDDYAADEGQKELKE